MWEALLPSVITGLFGAAGQKENNDTNVDLARENREFQERMSNTAYQRATEDMQKAGLNPMLAYSQGGATAPVGSMPQVQNVAAAGVNAAQQGASTVQAVQAILQSKAQTEQIEAETSRIKSVTLENQLNTSLALAQLEKTRNEARNVEEQIPGTRGEAQDKLERHRANILSTHAIPNSAFAADVAKRKAESQITQLEIPRAKAEADFYTGAGQYAPYLKSLIDILRAVTGIIPKK